MDGFLELVEFSVALSGFTSIVVVFAQKDRTWEPFDKFRIGNALLSSLGAAFLAAIPIGLLYLGIDETTVWKVMSIVTAVYLMLIVVLVKYRSATLLTEDQRALMPKTSVAIIISGTIVFSIALIVGLFVRVPWEIVGMNYFAILYLLLISVFAFVRMIFYTATPK